MNLQNNVVQFFASNVSFRDAMLNDGLQSDVKIIADGEIHRFKAKGDKANDSWYVNYGDGGAYGNWRRGDKYTWFRQDVGDRRKSKIHKDVLTAQKSQRSERERIHLQVADSARLRWDAAIPVSSHPYLITKQVQSHGLRQEGNNLLVPLTSDKKIWSLQTISPNNKKLFLKGGRTGGCYFVIGTPHNNRLWIAEGYATGASVHESTGDCVVVAFNAGNLLPVSKTIRRLFKSHHIYIAADNDDVGVRKADEALFKSKLHGRHRPPVERGITDWNDFCQRYGKEQTRTNLLKVLAP